LRQLHVMTLASSFQLKRSAGDRQAHVIARLDRAIQ
jgi:hypothetical protein